MPLRINNTLTKTLERFEPESPPKVSMYHCGPTVYSFAHVGNFRAFLLGDLLRRVLTQRGYEVTQVMNITDVGHLTEDDLDQGEDKLTRAARAEQRTPEQVAEAYTEAFFQDVDALGMLRAHHYPRASRHVPTMIKHIKLLEDRGFAYQSGDTVLFDVSKIADYGKLSGRKLEDQDAGFGGRVSKEELAAKRNPQDFRLWKVDPNHLMRWDSPWGPGYPGWHIECSTMSMEYLGETIDIHTGGEDNVFPHHESEIAQSEALTGKTPFARYWLHTQHLMINGKKMSKSLGNTYRVERYVDEFGVHPLALRLAILSMHHGKQGNLNDDGVKDAQKTLDHLRNFERRMQGRTGEGGLEETQVRIRKFRSDFDSALDSDLNVSAALAAIQTFLTDINRLEPGAMGGQEAISAIRYANEALGIIPEPKDHAPIDGEMIEQLIEQRVQLRKKRRFEEADQVRKDLSDKGIVLEDGPQGTTWRVKGS